VVFVEVGVLEISTSIDGDWRLIDEAYKPVSITCAFGLLAISGSYINKLIS